MQDKGSASPHKHETMPADQPDLQQFGRSSGRRPRCQLLTSLSMLRFARQSESLSTRYANSVMTILLTLQGTKASVFRPEDTDTAQMRNQQQHARGSATRPSAFAPKNCSHAKYGRLSCTKGSSDIAWLTLMAATASIPRVRLCRTNAALERNAWSPPTAALSPTLLESPATGEASGRLLGEDSEESGRATASLSSQCELPWDA